MVITAMYAALNYSAQCPANDALKEDLDALCAVSSMAKTADAEKISMLDAELSKAVQKRVDCYMHRPEKLKDLETMFTYISQFSNLLPDPIYHAIIAAECGGEIVRGDMKAISSRGAKGLFQLMPRTIYEHNLRADHHTNYAFDFVTNIYAGIGHHIKHSLADEYPLETARLSLDEAVFGAGKGYTRSALKKAISLKRKPGELTWGEFSKHLSRKIAWYVIEVRALESLYLDMLNDKIPGYSVNQLPYFTEEYVQVLVPNLTTRNFYKNVSRRMGPDGISWKEFLKINPQVTNHASRLTALVWVPHEVRRNYSAE